MAMSFCNNFLKNSLYFFVILHICIFLTFATRKSKWQIYCLNVLFLESDSQKLPTFLVSIPDSI